MSAVRATLKILGAIVAGVTIRLLLMNSSYQKDIADRVEVSSPMTSWKRATEGVFLLDNGISPYSGDTFHEQPLFVFLYQYMINHWPRWIPLFFIFVDVLTAIMLAAASFAQLWDIDDMEDDTLSKLKNGQDYKKLAINRFSIMDISVSVGSCYLLLPFSILSCVGQSTSTLMNMYIACLMLGSSLGYRWIAAYFSGLLAYQSMYSGLLVFPAMLMLEHQWSRKTVNGHEVYHEVDFKDKKIWLSMTWTFVLSSCFLIFFLFLSSFIMNGNWDFVTSSYYFQLSVPDLTPNIGIFWYFFTEMFDHFRTFFLWTFQINIFIYTIPLAVALRKNPFMMFFVQLILLAILKPYPSISDVAIYLSLIGQWAHLSPYLKHSLVSGATIVTCSVLAPILWNLWIVMGTANSNFYFGVTLAFNTAQILLVTDYCFAFTKRQYYLKHGIRHDDKTGKPKIMELVFDFTPKIEDSKTT